MIIRILADIYWHLGGKILACTKCGDTVLTIGKKEWCASSCEELK